MIGQGLVALINAALPPTVLPCTLPDCQPDPQLTINMCGGYNAQLPKDAPLPAWSWKVISSKPQTALQSANGFVRMLMEIDVYGNDTDQKITLSELIKPILVGYRGTLPDPDATYVDSCFLSDEMDFDQDEDSRGYRRMLEFDVWYSV